MLRFQARILDQQVPYIFAPWMLMLKGLKGFQVSPNYKSWIRIGWEVNGSWENWSKFRWSLWQVQKVKGEMVAVKMGYGIGRYFVAVIIFKIEKKSLNVHWEVPIKKEVKFLRKYEGKNLDSKMEECFFHPDLVKESVYWWEYAGVSLVVVSG